MSFLVHCVRFPNPGDSFISIEEALQMMRAEMEERRDDMENWLSQVMAPLLHFKSENDCQAQLQLQLQLQLSWKLR